MKPRHNLFLRSASLAAILGLGGIHSAKAASFWWDGTTGNWSDTANWSTTLGGTTNPATLPLATASDTLYFNTTPGAASTSTLYLNGNRGTGSILATLNFSATGATTLLGGNTTTAANNDLYIPSSITAITVNAGAGAVTIGDTAASPTRAVNLKIGTSTYTNNSSSLLTIANSLQTRGSSGTTTLTIDGSGNTRISGAIAGGAGASIALAKSGNGILTLSGANGYGGGTAITGGTMTFLNTGAKSTAGSGNHVFSAGTTLGLGVATSGSFYSSTDITNAFALNGIGTGNLARISVTSTTNVGIDTTAGDFDRGAITGAPTKGLAKLGINTLTLSGTNTYTGVTTVSGGTLKVNSTGVINTASASGGTGTVIGGSTLDIDGGTVNFNGANALAVGDNTSAGNVIVRAGSTLNLTGAIPIGQGSSGSANTPVSTVTQLGGTTTIGASSTLYLGNYRGATMDIQGGSLTSASSANIGVRGNSTLTISGANTGVTFTSIALGNTGGLTTATSDVNLNGGTLTLGASGFTKAGTSGAKTVSFDGGTLKASATSTDFVNADFVYVKAGGATINTDVNEVTIDNQLLQFGASTGALTKSGAGKLTLSAANTYTGTTTIDTGTLALGSGGSINNSSGVNLVNDGHFNVSAITSYSVASLTGNGSVTGDLTVTGALGIGASPGTVTFNDDLTLGGSSISTFEINDLTSLYDLAKGGTDSQTVTFGGTLILNFFGGLDGFNTTGSVKIFDFEIYGGDFNLPITTNGLASGYTATFNSDTGFVTVVPEPGAVFIGSLGLLCLLRRRR